MKFNSMAIAVSLITTFALSANGQTFLKQHYFPQGPTKYSCITDIGTNYLIAGAESSTGHQVVLVEIDPAGDIVDQHWIRFGDGAEEVTPLGILWDASGTDPFVIIAGYIGDPSPDFSNAFVFKYNYNSNTVVWANRLDKIGIYTDIDFLSTGDYVVSGEIMGQGHEQENALIYKINKTTGVPTEIYEATEAIDGSDTYYALVVNNDKIIAPARFELNTQSFDGMRPVITSYNTTTSTPTSYYYLKGYPVGHAGIRARLYPLDITRSGGSNYYTVVTGDIDGILLNRDLYVIRTGSTLSSNWQRRIKLTAADDCEGQLNSIKLYNEDTHINFPIVFGTLCDGGNLGSTAFMFRLSQNGSTVQWINRYDAQVEFNTFGNLCPNSMIVDGDKIYAVGWSMAENFVGAVLSTNVSDGVIGDCSEAMTIPTTENSDVESSITFTNPVIGFDPAELTRTVGEPTAYEITPCEEEEEMRMHHDNSENVMNTLTDLMLTIQQSASHTDFYLTTDETASGYTLQIIDMSGKTVLESRISNDEHVSATLLAGMYVTILTGDDKVIESQKFVVK